MLHSVADAAAVVVVVESSSMTKEEVLQPGNLLHLQMFQLVEDVDVDACYA